MINQSKILLAVLVPLCCAKSSLADPFSRYLDTSIPIADGFDYPVGDKNAGGAYTDSKTGKLHRGWYKATTFAESNRLGIHPGEDWNGRGGANTDLGQPVYSTANGRVEFAGQYGKLWGNVVGIRHVYYENHQRKSILSLYAHLDQIKVKRGDTVGRREQVGTIGQDPEKLYYAHLHFELRRNLDLEPTYWPSTHNKTDGWVRRNYINPTDFIDQHRKLLVPQAEDRLVLVDHDSYKMSVYRRGKLQQTYDVSFGQEKGAKIRRGDNKTPKGMYFITSRYQGPIGGPHGAYYGGHWIKINYPNKFDAARGVKDGLITPAQADAISNKWAQRKLGNDKTAVGGGIGFHGWIREWPNDGPRHLSWGCIVMHNRDVAEFYEFTRVGAMVVIF